MTRSVLALLLLLPLCARGEDGECAAPPAPLRVCADPNNLPFSNARQEGFENALAELIAAEMDRDVEYTWWPQRRGFIRNTLEAGACDVVIGVPERYELAQTTTPYYRSSYVFVTRRADRLRLESLDDPRLHKLRIGVHAIGDDYSNVPPAQALAMRGMADGVRGYSIYGDYSQPDPPRALIDALERGEIDVAIAWGPLAGYFAQQATVPLDVVPLLERDGTPLLPMRFAVAMGVRRGDDALASALEAALSAQREQIHALLLRYGVPLVDDAGR